MINESTMDASANKEAQERQNEGVAHSLGISENHMTNNEEACNKR
jgi:hypothetical protein